MLRKRNSEFKCPETGRELVFLRIRKEVNASGLYSQEKERVGGLGGQWAFWVMEEGRAGFKFRRKWHLLRNLWSEEWNTLSYIFKNHSFLWKWQKRKQRDQVIHAIADQNHLQGWWQRNKKLDLRTIWEGRLKTSSQKSIKLNCFQLMKCVLKFLLLDVSSTEYIFMNMVQGSTVQYAVSWQALNCYRQ